MKILRIEPSVWMVNAEKNLYLFGLPIAFFLFEAVNQGSATNGPHTFMLILPATFFFMIEIHQQPRRNVVSFGYCH